MIIFLLYRSYTKEDTELSINANPAGSHGQDIPVQFTEQESFRCSIVLTQLPRSVTRIIPDLYLSDCICEICIYIT